MSTLKASNFNPSGTRSAPLPNGLEALCPYCLTSTDAEQLDDRPEVGQLCIGCHRVERQP